MAKQEKYTDIRIEAREVGFDEDTEESTYEFALCYTNLNSQPTRMVLDALRGSLPGAYNVAWLRALE